MGDLIDLSSLSLKYHLQAAILLILMGFEQPLALAQTPVSNGYSTGKIISGAGFKVGDVAKAVQQQYF